MNQKIIGLDETGIFEGNDKNIRLIGGFETLCEDPAKEEKDWGVFFIELLEEINEEQGWDEEGYRLVYPYSLHMSSKNIFVKVREDGTPDFLSYDTRKRVRAAYEPKRSAVSDRIVKRTLERMRERKYRLYALVDSGAIGGIGSNVVDFDVAGNRYERLAVLALYHNIFYRPKPDPVDTMHLHLATRSIYVRAEEEEAATAAKQLYHQSGTDQQGARYYTNTTQSTFKTAIADQYYERGHLLGKVDFSFHVEQVNYRIGEGQKQPFLYLADIACSYLRQLLLRKGPIEAKEACLLPLDLWVYGEVDKLWRRAVERYQEGRLGEAFALLYDMKQGCSPIHDYYRKYWAETLEKQLAEELRAPGESGAARRKEVFSGMAVFLAEIEQDMMNHRLERGFYLAERMRDILDCMGSAEPRYRVDGKRYLFQIHDLMLRGLNYRGAVNGLREHIDECDRYRSAVQVEEYIYHIIRVLQYYFNSYRFDRAEEVAAHLESTVDKLMEAYQACTLAGEAISGEILGSGAAHRQEVPLKCLAAGRLYSTLGQAYAFLGKYGPAKKHFYKAEEVFGPGENARITLCHEMQLYIDQKKQKEYERAAAEYFGTDHLWEQWKRLADGLPQSCYGLQAYLKAFRIFYAKDRSQDLIVNEIVKRLTSGKGYQGHPWQIIYQNLYQIVRLTGAGAEQAEWIKDRMLTCTKAEPCMEVMGGYYRILVSQEDAKELKAAVAEFRRIVERHALSESFPELASLTTEHRVCRYLKKKIRYEYV